MDWVGLGYVCLGCSRMALGLVYRPEVSLAWNPLEVCCGRLGLASALPRRAVTVKGGAGLVLHRLPRQVSQKLLLTLGHVVCMVSLGVCSRIGHQNLSL